MKPEVPLEELIYRLIDGQLTDGERARLMEGLRDDPALRAEYYEIVAQHAILHHELGDASHEPAAPETVRWRTTLTRFFTQPTPLSLSVSAGVMFILLSALAMLAPPAFRIFSRQDADSDERPVPFVARFADEFNSKWQAGAAGTSLGSQIVAGRRLKLIEGLAQFQFRNGAVVILEGPADFEFMTDEVGFLREGKLTARTSGETFTVQTEAATIVDLGTEFGVLVEQKTSVGVFVFHGKVEVQQSGKVVQLGTGESLQIKRGQAKPESSAPMSFIRTLPESLDVGDIIAGGDGKGRRREAGIDLRTGDLIARPWSGVIPRRAEFRPCDNHPLVDGVFIVAAGNSAQQINSAGQTSTELGSGHAEAWNSVRTESDGSVYLHANAGITLDLLAIRRLHHSPAVDFEAIFGSQSKHPGKGRIVLLVDDRVVASQVFEHGANFPVRVPLSPDARFLTLVLTDAGDGLSNDGIRLLRPRIRLQATRTNHAATSPSESERN